MTAYGYTPDRDRRARMGLDEAVLCRWKQPAQIAAIVADAVERGTPMLLTRLDADAHAALPAELRERLDYDAVSATAILDPPPVSAAAPRVAVVTAGTSDVGVAREALRTLAFHGEPGREIHDVGVAGLWRVMERVEELGAIVAVPTSTGYGVAEGGGTALRSLLSSCAPGIAVVNIDNGYGAACAALRIVRALDVAR